MVSVKLPYSLLRRLLFLLPGERSHEVSLRALDMLATLRLSGLLASAPAPDPVRCLGLEFPNPVGLAAGLDKNGEHIERDGILDRRSAGPMRLHPLYGECFPPGGAVRHERVRMPVLQSNDTRPRGADWLAWD